MIVLKIFITARAILEGDFIHFVIMRTGTIYETQ